MQQIVFAVLVFTMSFNAAIAAKTLAPAHEPPAHTLVAPVDNTDLGPNPAKATAEDIFALSVFSEPLVPVGHTPTQEENGALLEGLKQYSQRKNVEDLSALTNWLVNNPDSAWRVALLTNLGIGYYKNGYFSKALETWDQAWHEGKDEKSPRGKAIVDRAVGELVRMHARIGHVDRLKELFKELEGRTLAGAANQYVTNAREGLWMMENEPGVSFLCGPMALRNVFKTLSPIGADIAPIEKARSGKQGFSLQEVQDLANAAKLKYHMAKRKPGAAIPLPAVAHWKVDHYAALVGEQNGLYHLKDPTFGSDLWISKAALENETSGYYLIADKGSLPEGWETVNAEEAKSIRGMGNTGDNGPPFPDDKKHPPGCDGEGGMAGYNFSSMAVSLNIFDKPLHYKPAVGPDISFRVNYSQREVGQPANFNYSNLGAKWSHNWLGYVVDTPDNLQANVTVIPPRGGFETYINYSTGTHSFDVQRDTQAILTRTQDSPAIYQRKFPDGRKEIYAQLRPAAADGTRQVFLTQVVDPQGNAVTLGYDKKFRLMSLTDTVGKVTQFSYTDKLDSYKITKVTDPFGRSATFTYSYVDAAGLACDPKVRTDCIADKLASSKDTVGMVSSFQYAPSSDFLNTLKTPYGKTTFDFGENTNNGPQRWLLATDPLGKKERIEFLHNAPGIAGSEAVVPSGMSVINQYLIYRNTFYWDKRATAEACTFSGTNATCDYTKAHIDHWTHGPSDNFWTTASILESEEDPLENRVWYSYTGQPAAYQPGTSNQPSAVGRVLDDGSTQLKQYAYNPAGRMTQSTDPMGRTLFMEYDPANQIDLLKVWRKNSVSCDIPKGIKTGCDLLAEYTYNAQHLPLTYTDAAKQLTQYSYNQWGQPLTVTNALNQVTQFTYIEDKASPNYRRLETVSRANRTLAKFTYDLAGRVRTAKDAGNYTLTYDYDNLDRLLKTTYPDKTFEQLTYDRMEVGTKKDRIGRVTTYQYNALRQLHQTIYPKNPGDPDRIITQEWCACGALESLTDAKGQTTRWSHDLQRRVTGKFYPANTSDTPNESYVYENTTSRLHSVFNKRDLDATGKFLTQQQTDYNYYADDRIQNITYDVGGLNEVATPPVNFNYDPWYPRTATMFDGLGKTQYNYYPAGVQGAGQIYQEDGPWLNDTLQYTYDKLNHPETRQINNQGKIKLAYDPLERLYVVSNPLGSFTYTYLGATDQVTDITSKITKTKLGPHTHIDYWDNLHDRRLKHLEQSVGLSPQTLMSAYDYEINPVGQITRWVQQPYGQPTQAADYRYDAIDELIGVAPLNAASGSAYSYDYDLAGNRKTETVDGMATDEISNNLNQLTQRGSNANSFDDNGNQTANGGVAQNYHWDGADQLISVANAIDAGTHSDFVFDGLGRRKIIRDYQGDTLVSEKRYIWCGLALCEERDGKNTVTKRYFDQGETRGTTQLYYTQDHLGSIRELTDANGSVKAQYSYDPWGRMTKLDGDLDSDFGFTGHFYHAASGLHLAPYRGYSSEIGRWISRDPISEIGGINIYNYVLNNPVNYYDYDGRIFWVIPILIGAAEQGILRWTVGMLFDSALFWCKRNPSACFKKAAAFGGGAGEAYCKIFGCNPPTPTPTPTPPTPTPTPPAPNPPGGGGSGGCDSPPPPPCIDICII